MLLVQKYTYIVLRMDCVCLYLGLYNINFAFIVYR